MCNNTSSKIGYHSIIIVYYWILYRIYVDVGCKLYITKYIKNDKVASTTKRNVVFYYICKILRSKLSLQNTTNFERSYNKAMRLYK